jgi:hypothetical protein
LTWTFATSPHQWISPICVGLEVEDFTEKSSKLLQIKWLNMRKYILKINIYLYCLYLIFFYFLVPEAINLLKWVRRVMHSNVMSHRSINVVFQKLYFAIKKRCGLLSICILFRCNYLIYNEIESLIVLKK